MLEMYYHFLGEEHPKSQLSKKWILENFPKKTLFERATAIDVLIKLNIQIEPKHINAFKQDIMSVIQTNSESSINEFKLFRFCATLYRCNFLSECIDLAKKFNKTQDKQEGKWVNISHTASVVDLLINIQNKSERPDSLINEMIYKAVEFLYSVYDTQKSCWANDVSSTAKSVRALRNFEQNVIYPIDVVKGRLMASEIQIKNSIAIDTASQLNVNLLNDLNNLYKNNSAVHNVNENLVRLKTRYHKYFVFSIIPCILLFAFMFSFFVYLIGKGAGKQIRDNIWNYFIDNLPVIAPIIVLASIVIMLILINEIFPIPSKIKKILAPLFPEQGFTKDL